MDNKDKELRAKFDFVKFALWLAQMTGLFFCMLVLLCGLKKALVYYGFHVSFERVFASCSAIAADWAWPCCILIVIFLFNENLETVAELIGKAWNGNQGAIQPANGTKEEDDESTDDKNFNKDSREYQNRKYKAFENYALGRLQQEEGVIVKRNVKVFDSMYGFDGAFEKGDLLYIVEVKIRVEKEPLRRFLLKADGIYQDLPKSQRKSLRTLVCVLMNDGEKGMANAMRKLSGLRDEVSVPVEFRFYPFDYDEQQGVKS